MTATIDRPQIAAHAAADGPDRIAASLLREGVVVVRGLLAPGVVAAFNGEIEPYLDPALQQGRRYMNATLPGFFGVQTHHVSGIAGKSAVFRDEILCHPLLVAMCDHVLQPNCVTYQLNFADVMDRGPGAPAQIMHRDDGIWPNLPNLGFPLEFATMIALGPFTPEMGATRVVPGSHAWPKDRAPREEEIVAAALEPGDALFYLGSTLHGGGANLSERRRRGMHLSYCLGWLRTEDNNYLIAPLELARTLPREQQAMLGYALHDGVGLNGGFLGAVDWRDPLDLIEEGLL